MRGEPFKEAWKTCEAIFYEMDALWHGGWSDSQPGEESPDPGSDSSSLMTIRQLMTLDPITIRPETPLHRALGVLIEKELGALPVVDEHGAIVGILRERDLLRALNEPDAMTVAAVMNAEPVTVEVDESIVEVVDRLMGNDLRRVLVREGSTLVGVVTRADLMPAILDLLHERAQRARMVSLVSH